MTTLSCQIKYVGRKIQARVVIKAEISALMCGSAGPARSGCCGGGSDEEALGLMGRNEDGHPGAYTTSIKTDGSGAPHRLLEHVGMPQATANAESRGNAERFQSFTASMCAREKERWDFLFICHS